MNEITAALITILAASLPGILVAITTAFFSSRFYVNQAKSDLEKERKSRYHQQKWKIYSQFADVVRKYLEATGGVQLITHLTLWSEEFGFASRLWLVASDEVLRAYSELARYTWEQGKDSEVALRGLMKVFVEMRKDLGESTSISVDDLSAAFPGRLSIDQQS